MQRKINDTCFENFWLWFEKSFAESEVLSEVSKQIFNHIEGRFIDLYARYKSDSFDRNDVERKFWKLVFSGKKFIKALMGGQHD